MIPARPYLLPPALAAPAQRGGNNIDPMVVPPFTLPPDANTFVPDDVSSYRQAGQQPENISYQSPSAIEAIAKLLMGAVKK